MIDAARDLLRAYVDDFIFSFFFFSRLFTRTRVANLNYGGMNRNDKDDETIF